MMIRKPTRSVICSTNQELHVFDNDDDTFEMHEEYVVLKGELTELTVLVPSSLYLYETNLEVGTLELRQCKRTLMQPSNFWISHDRHVCAYL